MICDTFENDINGRTGTLSNCSHPETDTHLKDAMDNGHRDAVVKFIVQQGLIDADRAFGCTTAETKWHRNFNS